MPGVKIIQSVMSVFVEEGRDLHRLLKEAEGEAQQLEKRLETTREAAQARRIEMGMHLLKVRDALPRRAVDRQSGWLAYLDALEMSDTTAYRYMDLARGVVANPQNEKVGNKSESSGEERVTESVPPPDDEDLPADPPNTEPKPDRDTWCTPKWITDALGRFDLDPCGNERSHVQAGTTFDLSRGEDGIERAAKIGHDWRVFINPPYSNVRPWIDAYKHTRFCFLVKFDPSTKWCEALLEHTSLILFPRRTRVEFEPPPGVSSDGGVQFPHGLFFARAEDASAEIREQCFAWTPAPAA